MSDSNEELLSRRVEEVIDLQSLSHKLASGRKLRVKLGIDPNKPDLHIGHAVPLMKLREFQDAGHTAVLIIGDWTAVIGDPSGKDKTRPTVARKEIEKNSKAFFAQAYLILDKRKTEVRLQSEWYKKFGLQDLVKLTSLVSVKEMLNHETFRKRLENAEQFGMHEMLYPLLQGYDSVTVKADVELGAMEQKFNLLMGRTVQKAFGQPPQDVMLLPYLIGLDGKEKMSKSLDNYIALTDSANEMFGKVMSVPDSLIFQYFKLCTNTGSAELQRISATLKAKSENPRTLKVRLAEEIVTLYHGVKLSEAAVENFEKKFGKNKDVSAATADFEVRVSESEMAADELLVILGLAVSKSEASRKIKEGAVSDGAGAKITDPKQKITTRNGMVIRLGKRTARIKKT